MRGVPEVLEVDEPYENANNSDDFSQHVAEVVQFAFERGLFSDLRSNGFVNITNGGFLASENNNCLGSPVNDSGSLNKQKR